MKLFLTRRIDVPLTPETARREDPKFASGKIAFLQYLTVAIFLFLISGFWELQVQNPEVYSERAVRNSIKALPILAPRGRILDRDNRVIVDNQPSYSLILSREEMKDANLRPIAEGLGMEYDDLANRLRRFRNLPKYEAVVIKEQLTPAELTFVEAHKDPNAFPELETIAVQRRLYPRDSFAAHVIGYVGEVSEPELNTAEFARYDQGDVIGKFAIERQYNEHLMGVDGERQVEVDSRGRERSVLGVTKAEAGKDLQLTLDLDLQAVAELAMDGKRGAVVALDPRTGEVLAMVSRPAFDPNLFTGRIRTKDWKALIENPENPLLNRAIQSRLAPGSTFKPLVALAGLEKGVIDDTFSVSCPGGASFYGHYFRCHEKGGHGRVELLKGIAQSCDVYFYNVGNKLGIDNIAEYAKMAGLGEKTGIDLPHEAEGLVPSTQWKLRAYRQKWYAGETISVAIGQGALEVSPLQLAYAIGGLATGGVWMRPHLVKENAKREPARRADFNLDNVSKVIYGMYAVVNEGGTGGRARIPGIDVAGKTGTSQLASNEYLKGSKAGREMKDNAWFVGFAPRQSPEIVVVALYEGGLHGHMAAPIVRDVIKSYFDKRARKAEPQRRAAAYSLGLSEPALAQAKTPVDERPVVMALPMGEPVAPGNPGRREVSR